MDKITETEIDEIDEIEEIEEIEEIDEDINDLIEKDSYLKNDSDQNCLYQSTNILSEEEEEELIYDSDEYDSIKYIKEEERITDPIMTKYEFVRILGFRTKQITLGSKILLKNVKHLEIPEIARLELKNKMIPLKIKRPLPNNKYEIWKISELEIPKIKI